MGTRQAANLNSIRDLILSRPLTRDETEGLARQLTRTIEPAQLSAHLCESLIATIGQIPVADWLSRDVGDAIRERVLGILDEVEAAGHGEGRSVA